MSVFVCVCERERVFACACGPLSLSLSLSICACACFLACVSVCVCVFVCVLLPMFNIVQYGKKRSTSKWFLEHPWCAHTHTPKHIPTSMRINTQPKKRYTDTHSEATCNIRNCDVLVWNSQTAYTYTHTLIHTNTRTHICTYTHTHTHTHLHTRTCHIYIMIFYNTFTCV